MSRSAAATLRELALGLQGRVALQCAVCLLIAFGIMQLLPWPRPYWVVLTSFMVGANSFGETTARSLERIVGTVLGLLAGTILWLAAGRLPIIPVGLVAISIFALFYERAARYRVILFWLSLLLSLLFHIADSPEGFYVARLVDTLIGAAIGVFVTMVLLPVRTGDAVRVQMADFLMLVASRLRRMGAALADGSGYARDPGLREVTDAAEKLQSLAYAAGLEALLLRRPRLDMRQRAAATARIARCLLYADQIAPMLHDTGSRLCGMLSGPAQHIEDVAHAIRDGTPVLRGAGWDQARARATWEALQQAGAPRLELQAGIRLLEAVIALMEGVGQFAAMAPATSARQGRSQPVLYGVTDR